MGEKGRKVRRGKRRCLSEFQHVRNHDLSAIKTTKPPKRLGECANMQW